MLLDEQELKDRLESPLNLLNRLRNATNPHRRSQAHGEAVIPSLPPTASELVPNLEEKIQHGAIKSKAMNLIVQAMDELKIRMPEAQKPRELADIAVNLARVIGSVHPVSNMGAASAQIVIYAPQIMTEETYNVVELNEV